MPIPVEVFIDVVCPFCLLIEPTLDELQHTRDVELEIRPFELRPAPVPTLRPEDDYLPRVWREAVLPLASRLKIPITLPTISPQPRSERAFLILQLAREQGIGKAWTDAVLKAFFQEDKDIGSPQILIDIATSVGLDHDEVTAALGSEVRRRQHQADLRHARDEVGITAVPGIVVAGHLLPGVPDITRLQEAVDAAASRPEVNR
ncbi:thioredoxin [Arachnia propionica]|uniref:Thioredoxin n=1 Tax=Arachnia propionica TaxID=1750 RepID=A0A3P1TD79_9ACTN|nr:DsbA family protein [Arachnia propionica]RRD07344.1 thioredoxin [Arachnia propionica]